jgi:hypothetical protein
MLATGREANVVATIQTMGDLFSEGGTYTTACSCTSFNHSSQQLNSISCIISCLGVDRMISRRVYKIKSQMRVYNGQINLQQKNISVLLVPSNQVKVIKTRTRATSMVFIAFAANFDGISQ